MVYNQPSICKFIIHYSLSAEEDMVQILEPALKVSNINDQLSAVLIVCTLISCFMI